MALWLPLGPPPIPLLAGSFLHTSCLWWRVVGIVVVVLGGGPLRRPSGWCVSRWVGECAWYFYPGRPTNTTVGWAFVFHSEKQAACAHSMHDHHIMEAVPIVVQRGRAPARMHNPSTEKCPKDMLLVPPPARRRLTPPPRSSWQGYTCPPAAGPAVGPEPLPVQSG